MNPTMILQRATELRDALDDAKVKDAACAAAYSVYQEAMFAYGAAEMEAKRVGELLRKEVEK